MPTIKLDTGMPRYVLVSEGYWYAGNGAVLCLERMTVADILSGKHKGIYVTSAEAMNAVYELSSVNDEFDVCIVNPEEKVLTVIATLQLEIASVPYYSITISPLVKKYPLRGSML